MSSLDPKVQVAIDRANKMPQPFLNYVDMSKVILDMDKRISAIEAITAPQTTQSPNP